MIKWKTKKYYFLKQVLNADLKVFEPYHKFAKQDLV